MKTKLLLFAFVVFACYVFAQPQGINYQGVARDALGSALVNQNISLRLSILDSSASGQSVYVETQNATTNNTGLFNLSIGAGAVVSGVFANIPWGAADKWLKVEMDASGGNNYQLIGTSQFLSVPYALHANNATNIANAFTQYQEFSVPGSNSWTVPAGVYIIMVELSGGGGGGAVFGPSCSGNCASGGGGGGGYGKQFINVIPGTTYPLTIGAGGIGAPCNSNFFNAGTGGGTTTFGSIYATGGGGAYWDNGSRGGAPGNSNATYIKYTGGAGSSGSSGGNCGGGGGNGGGSGYASGEFPGGGGAGNPGPCSIKAGNGANGRIIIWW